MGNGSTKLFDLGSALKAQNLPEDPLQWQHKHKVKCAIAMFDVYDKNDDDKLESAELTLLFKDFAYELKLFYNVPDELTPANDGIKYAVEDMFRRYDVNGDGYLTYHEYEPMFLKFCDDLLSQ